MTKRKKLNYTILVLIAATMGCGKGGDAPATGGNGNGNGGGNNGGADKSTCLLSVISQVNSGQGAESALSIFYNSQYAVSKLVIYDSVDKIKDFEADFNYITPDSVRIDAYQYLILDAGKRVTHFATKSDMINPEKADSYLFEYIYNADGYLATKNLYINDSRLPNFSTAYTYTNNLLTNCVMTAVSSGSQKVLESNLSYDNSTTSINWMYTFPDAMEGYAYLTALNFGNRPSHPLQQVVTTIYDPASQALLDTWTTHYRNYKVDESGNIISGEANGDLQQGIAAFYGQTRFYYNCY